MATAVAERGGSGLRLALLRGFELRRDGQSLPLSMSTQRLVAFLALRDRQLHRIYVAGMLWLDTCEDRACANLRTAVWRLRRLDRDLVETSGTHLRLGRHVAVDVHEACAQAQRLLDPAADCDGTDLATTRLAGDILPDWYDDWVLIEQERFRQIRLHALEALCERLIAVGRFGAAVEAGLAAVTGEPLRESGQRVLIRAHLAEGNPGEALRQYSSYRRILCDELGLEPSQLMKDLVTTIRTSTAVGAPA